MPKIHLLDVRQSEPSDEHGEPLLGSSNEIDDTEAAIVLQPLPSHRHSSITRPQAQGHPRTPRTPNRVRFNIQERKNSSSSSSSEHGLRAETIDGADEEDYFSHHNSPGREGHISQRAPLLTDIEAPIVTVANAGLNSQIDDLLENPRPKSGMMSAFMNMANSIM